MTAPEPRLGAVYDVGAATAIYWPDTHPCGPNRPEPWLILLSDGGTEWAAECVLCKRKIWPADYFVDDNGDAWELCRICGSIEGSPEGRRKPWPGSVPKRIKR